MSLDQLISRLEVATQRLEALAGSSSASGSSQFSASSGSSSSGDSSEMVEAFNEIINGPLKTFTELSAKLAPEVKEQGELFSKAVVAQKNFLVVVSKSKKPADSALPDLLKPTSDLITQVQQCFEKNRNKKEVANFLSAVSEGVPALGWVMMSPKPAPHVVQMKEAAEFYTNRVLKEATDDTQKSWARTLPNVLNEIANFVKKYHTTGVVWNPKGGEASAASSSSTTSTNTSTTTSSSSSSSNSTPSTPPKTEGSSAPTPNLFAALNKGSDITSGLKKVDKSQMTHKNPELRAGGVVQAKDEKEKVEKTTGGKVEDKPPKFALEGNKWVVEFQKKITIISLLIMLKINTQFIYINAQVPQLLLKEK